MSEAWVILETSGRGGHVGLAVDDRVAGEVALDPARRHNRDLAPAMATLLADAGLKPADLAGVMVSVGPGSFTGLRVGVMTAKSLAWALDCRLVPVPTFHAIAEQSPDDATTVDVISDALKGLVYAQRFYRSDVGWLPVNDLRIVPAVDWAGDLSDEVWVSGPGVGLHAAIIPADTPQVPPAVRTASVTGVLRVGLRTDPLTPSEIAGLEPLYLRPSSAEEAAARKAQGQ